MLTRTQNADANSLQTLNNTTA